MTQPEPTRATPAARERVVDTVVAAFEADPAFRFFFPDDLTYWQQASAFTGYVFDQRIRHGSIWLVEGGAAVALWDLPSTEIAAGSDAAGVAGAVGVPGAVADQPPQPGPNLPPGPLERLQAYHDAVHQLLPTDPHWYLGIFASHPEHKGKRWGRIAMDAGLREAAATGLPAYLETTNPGNVALYRKAGWEIVDILAVQSLTVWVMAAEPTTTDT
ncbi:MAG: GNAT family N-acetyltransferase [Sporichthyaceae bacterium]|nr:GNAT family N-acetyltransferase [Sporichthyaceae bacterium]